MSKRLFPRKCISIYEATYREAQKKKLPGETWDDFFARMAGIKKRRWL